MAVLRLHPDGYVTMQSGDLFYQESVKDFESDYGHPFPNPSGANHIHYEMDKKFKRRYLDRRAESIVPAQWVEGDKVISAIDSLIAAKAARTAESDSPPDPKFAYRRERMERYINELGKESSFEDTVGDVLDTIIKQLDDALDTQNEEFQELVGKVNQIKKDIPKPIWAENKQWTLHF